MSMYNKMTIPFNVFYNKFVCLRYIAKDQYFLKREKISRFHKFFWQCY